MMNPIFDVSITAWNPLSIPLSHNSFDAIVDDLFRKPDLPLRWMIWTALEFRSSSRRSSCPYVKAWFLISYHRIKFSYGSAAVICAGALDITSTSAGDASSECERGTNRA